MKQWLWMLVALSLIGMGAFAIAHGAQGEKSNEVTLKGQVIDLACYFTLGKLADDHQKCAETCVKGGSTAGFKTKDKTYVVIRDPMHQKDMPDLVKFVNKDAEITANVYERDGISGVKILTIK